MNRRTFLSASAAGLAAVGLGAVDLTRPHEALAIQALQAGQQAVVNTDSLNVRGGPGADEPQAMTLDGGTPVDLLAASSDGAWWRVATDNRVGWVSGQYLEPTGARATSQAFDVDLVLPFARQLTDVWCEAADIEMWMGYHGLASDIPSRARQQRIWDWEISHNAGYSVQQWNCSPYATASAAHEMMPSFGFDHFRYDDAMDGTRMLAWLLANPAHREPSIALIWRGAHYVLVRGVRASANPADDPTARILGIYIADPNRADRRWYGSDRYIPLDEWLGEVFLPVSYLTPHSGVPGDIWQNRAVAIQRTLAVEGPSSQGIANATPATYA